MKNMKNVRDKIKLIYFLLTYFSLLKVELVLQLCHLYDFSFRDYKDQHIIALMNYFIVIIYINYMSHFNSF